MRGMLTRSPFPPPARLAAPLPAVLLPAALLATIALLTPRLATQELAAQAPAADPSRLTIDRLHTTADFAARGLGPVRWMPGGQNMLRLEPSARTPGGQDLISYTVDSNARAILVPASRLIPEGADAPLRVDDFELFDGFLKLLIMTDAKPAWRHCDEGAFWLLDRRAGTLRQLGDPSWEPASLRFATPSPDGKKVCYVHAGNLWVEDLKTGAITALTDTDDPAVHNGTFGWVYEEEFGVRRAFRWSPDGSRVAFWRVDEREVGSFRIVDNLDAVYPRIQRIPYPKVGTTNPVAKIGVVAATGGEITWIDLSDITAGWPEHYVPRMDWAGDDELVLQVMNRAQDVNHVVLAAASGGATRTVFTDSIDGWLRAVDALEWLDDGSAFTWLSERDGWRHLWRIPRDGGAPTCLTPGDYDVAEVVQIDPIGGFAWFLASPDDPTERHLFRAPLAGGDVERVTPEGTHGWNTYDIAPGGRFAIHTHSAFLEPPTITTVALPGHQALHTHVDNAAVRQNIAALDLPEPEFFRVDIGDGVSLDGWLMKPAELDPSRKYPLLVHVYGEPAACTVTDRWGGGNQLWHAMLTQRGYAVMSLDNRGTPSPRGAAWRQVVHGQIGILAPVEQAKGVYAALERFPWLDRERVGSWGWSGGGSMTLNALFRYPDLYRCGIAIAFVADQRLYDTIYQERYMGLLGANPDGYRDGSPITHAANLAGDVLLVHGTGDDNVHYQNFERLVDRLIALDKPFEMLAYPNRRHGIHERENTRRHLFRSMTRWLAEHLPAGPR